VQDSVFIVEPLEVVVSPVAKEALGSGVVGVCLVLGYYAVFYGAHYAAGIGTIARARGIYFLCHDSNSISIVTLINVVGVDFFSPH
jgi:hypothetical protein